MSKVPFMLFVLSITTAAAADDENRVRGFPFMTSAQKGEGVLTIVGQILHILWTKGRG